jgi:hypothetical protein
VTAAAYLRALRTLIRRLPDCAIRFGPSDRSLVTELHRRGVPFDLVRGALLLAVVRRRFRDPQLPLLNPIRSLHYLMPVIDELLLQPLPHGYLAYLESKIPFLP